MWRPGGGPRELCPSAGLPGLQPPRGTGAEGPAPPAPVDVFLFARHLLCVSHWECSREKNRALQKRAGPHTQTPAERNTALGSVGTSGPASCRKAGGRRGRTQQKEAGEGEWRAEGAVSRAMWGPCRWGGRGGCWPGEATSADGERGFPSQSNAAAGCAPTHRGTPVPPPTSTAQAAG